ncbi:hypothetical protein Tco_1166872 [Tanacetum coccineum]
MIRMLQNISKEDLETLWKLVKTKHGNTMPEDDYEKVFWGDLKVITAGTKVNAAGLQLLEELLLATRSRYGFGFDQPEEQLEVFSAAKVLADAAKIRRGVKNVHTYTRRRTVSTGSGLVSTASMAGVSTASGLLQAGEKYSEEDLPRKLVELVSQRNKFFAQQRVEAKRNKPMTPAQQKAYMILTSRTKKELQQLMIIVPEEGMNVKALQTKYLIIDWEVYSENTIKFWKIIRVGNYTEVYQVFEDMLKNFDRDDLVKLWSLVYERFNSTELTDDKSKELWVELKRSLGDLVGALIYFQREVLSGPSDLSKPRSKSNHEFLGVDSEGGIPLGVALFSERQS